MAFSFGTGMLSTDPRTKKSAKGGSTHAGQPIDTSVLITGDNSDGTIGFGSASAFQGGLFQKPTVAPAPDFEDSSGYGMEKTSAEIEALTESRGVADTHANMGSLAVDYRASEQAKTDAGEQTTSGERATKILDTRAAEEYKRTISEPFQAEQAKFRAEAAAAKNMFTINKSTSNMNMKDANWFSGGGGGGSRSGPSTSMLNKRSSGILNMNKSTDIFGKADRSGAPQIIGPNIGAMMAEGAKVSAQNPDIGSLQAMGVHADAPGTQSKSTIEQAHAQSASGKASPGQISQAMASSQRRQLPNKRT